MATLTNDEILEAIAAKSVLEISELVKAMEEKFGRTGRRSRGGWSARCRCWRR